MLKKTVRCISLHFSYIKITNKLNKKTNSYFVLRISIISDLASKAQKHACIVYLVKNNNLQLIVDTVIKQAIQKKNN